ncbi:MAG: iron dependent repressor, metal binding and dimerization domain protein [Gaiellales bacterium]
MPRRTRPILLPCQGSSSRGVGAADIAEQLAERGLADVAENIEEAVSAAREGRAVIAVDGCSGSCQARLLDARGVQTLSTLNLSRPGVDGVTVGTDSVSVSDLEAAARPFTRTRRSRPISAGEPDQRRTHSTEDYLLALDALTSPVVECGVIAHTPTLAAHVAQALGISRPSAGAMLDRLEEVGYVRRGEHKEVLLTVEGRVAADRALRKQRILECFVTQALGYGIDECYERARELAPGFDDDAVDRTWAALGRPGHCPHGWPTDPNLARRDERGLVALSAAPASGRVTVERVDETSRERLQALAQAGIEPGRPVDGVTARPAAGMVTFTADGERRSISTVLAASVLVRVS